MDWSVSAYRGFEPFGLYDCSAADRPGRPAGHGAVYPRFTMVGGDFETVRGQWGIRGEVAVFVRDNFQSPEVRIVTGSSLDAGVGVDRRAGDYRLSGTVLFHSESYDDTADDRRGRRRPERRFARRLCRSHVRARALPPARVQRLQPDRGVGLRARDRHGELRDNLGLEASGGWFVGDGRDLVGRFADSDFVYVRLKYYF